MTSKPEQMTGKNDFGRRYPGSKRYWKRFTNKRIRRLGKQDPAGAPGKVKEVTRKWWFWSVGAPA